MAKTKEELDVLKQQYRELTKKLKELSEEELKEVTGGSVVIGMNGFENGGDRKDVFYECVCGLYFTNEYLYKSHLASCKVYNGNK